MKIPPVINLILSLLLPLVASVGAATQDRPVTVRAGLLIDGTGETRRNARIFIENGKMIKVVETSGNRVVVRELPETEKQSQESGNGK